MNLFNFIVNVKIFPNRYKQYIGTEVSDQKRNSTINIRLYNDLKKVLNFSQIFEQNINEAF